MSELVKVSGYHNFGIFDMPRSFEAASSHCLVHGFDLTNSEELLKRGLSKRIA